MDLAGFEQIVPYPHGGCQEYPYAPLTEWKTAPALRERQGLLRMSISRM